MEKLYRYEQEKNGAYTYALETPLANTYIHSWAVCGSTKSIFVLDARGVAYGGIRPAIEVHMSGIEK